MKTKDYQTKDYQNKIIISVLCMVITVLLTMLTRLFNVFFAILFLLRSLFNASQHENIRNIPIRNNPHEIVVKSQRSQQIFHIVVVITFMLPDLLKYQITNKIAHSIIQ